MTESYPPKLTLTAANNCTWTAGPFAMLDAAGAPLALPEGARVRMQLRAPAEADSAALELTLDNSRLRLVDKDAATIAIEVDAHAMATVAAKAYDIDVVVEYPSARVLRPFEGTVTIKQGVTR